MPRANPMDLQARPPNLFGPEPLRKLWVIYLHGGTEGGRTCLGRFGGWVSYCEDAASWDQEDRHLAEEVAARIVMYNPAMYFGRVEVVEIRG